jgi:hypothetical protein
VNVDWSGAYRLWSAEFTAGWDALGLGPELPIPLGLRRPGATVAERDRLARTARDGLAARGLTDPATGQPAAGFAAALRTIAQARYTVDLHTDSPRPLIALGSVAGEHGALTCYSPDTPDALTVLPVPGPRVAGTLVELAGPLTAGRFRAVNLDAAVFDRALRGATGPWELADRLRRLGVPAADASATARMFTDATGGGQLGVTDGAGRRGRWVVGYHRGPGGTFLQVRRPGPDGETVTVAPVGPEQLFARLTELVKDTAAVTSR